MRRNNIDNQTIWTLGFMRMCGANFLLFASVYMLFPVLPAVMVQKLDITLAQSGNMFLAFAAGMFVVGPFHAYLGDAYKRKSVILYSTFFLLVTLAGYLFIDSYRNLLLLAALQGACFGLATTAGITVAIDITSSSRRSSGNKAYALTARLGMLVGVGVGMGLYQFEGFNMVLYLAGVCACFSLLLAARVYVSFRAPIGVALCSTDRFLLVRGWLPAVNMVLIALVPGVLLPLMARGDYTVMVLLAVLVMVATPFTEILVRLSYHCQRGTANTTCNLAMDTGILVGMSVTCHLLATSPCPIYLLAGLILLLSLLLFGLLTYPFYKKRKKR